MCAVVTVVQTCALPNSMDRPVPHVGRLSCLSPSSTSASGIAMPQRGSFRDVFSICNRSTPASRPHAHNCFARRVRVNVYLRLRPGKPFPERYRHSDPRSDEHTSELQSLMRISYAFFCLKKKKLPITHKQ